MAYIYYALVDTPGAFAYLIRKFLKQKYVHVVLSMDGRLEEAYSFGRRNPLIPFFAGFERERSEKILRAFPSADYMVCQLECDVEQKKRILRKLREDYRRRWHYHYAVAGLPFIVFGIPFYQRNCYTCSSYIARLLYENGIAVSEKHFSLVTPKDFYLYPRKKVIYQGSLRAFQEALSKEKPSGTAKEKIALNNNMCGRMAAAYGR